jgi:hypothetical protein
MDVKCSTDVAATQCALREWYQSIEEWVGVVASLHRKLRRKGRCGLRRHAPLVTEWRQEPNFILVWKNCSCFLSV